MSKLIATGAIYIVDQPLIKRDPEYISVSAKDEKSAKYALMEKIGIPEDPRFLSLFEFNRTDLYFYVQIVLVEPFTEEQKGIIIKKILTAKIEKL